MAEANRATDVDGRPPYPSYEELRKANLSTLSKSPVGFRIFWTFNGPFPEAISVMKDKHSPDFLTTYFTNGAFHAISQDPISIPKISSVIVSIYELDQWESAWTECHNHHVDIGPPPPGTWYGALENYDPDYDSDRDELDHRLGCCGEARPRGKKASIVVKPASGDFVTVHDYFSTIHPWLLSFKADIESARGECFGEYDHDISGMMVDSNRLGCTMLEDMSRWIKDARYMWERPATPPAMVPLFGPLPRPSKEEPVPQIPYVPNSYHYSG